MVILSFLATLLWIAMLIGFLVAVFWVIAIVVFIVGLSDGHMAIKLNK
jgi:hypothetical protein